jgi:c-di-GMP-binding flagellar brake protein YcgR
MLNKRKEKRFNEENDVIIQYALNDKSSNHYIGINALTRDISLSGARIISIKTFPIDTILRIQINLSRTKQTIKVDGKVKWVRENTDNDTYEMGIEFLHEISKTVLTLIRHLYAEEAGIPSKVV